MVSFPFNYHSVSDVLMCLHQKMHAHTHKLNQIKLVRTFTNHTVDIIIFFLLTLLPHTNTNINPAKVEEDMPLSC